MVKYIDTLSCIPSYFKCTHYCLLLIRSLWSVLLFSVLRICAPQFCDCIVSDSRFYIFLERALTRTERGCAWPSVYAIWSAAKIYGPNVDLRSARKPRRHPPQQSGSSAENSACWVPMQNHSTEPRYDCSRPYIVSWLTITSTLLLRSNYLDVFRCHVPEMYGNLKFPSNRFCVVGLCGQIYLHFVMYPFLF